MAEQTYKINPSEVNGGIWLDTDPKDQPDGTRRFTLNAIDESNGQSERVYNEGSALSCSTFPRGYIPIGWRYIQDNTKFVILVNPTQDKQDIGIIDSTDNYINYINTGILQLSIQHQCDIRFRVRRGNERVFYWVDGLNTIRSLNIDRLYNYYNNDYKIYIKNGGDPNIYGLEKWDSLSFNLIKTYTTIPFFNNIEVLEFGSILPGSYNFTIQYVDEDLNPTNWITTTNIVRIYNDTVNNPFERIRGSRNVDTSSQSFPRANKSVRLTMGSLDNRFPYYRIGIIRASSNTGIPETVLVSDLQATTESTFLYTGNDDSLTTTSLADILVDKALIYAPQHIEQKDNRLLVANTKDKNVNWCDYQKFASKISSDLVTKSVILNSELSDPNIKNPKSTFVYRGYMPGEGYSFGVVYLDDDGTLSPVFHIPGKNILDTVSKMKYLELQDNYLDIHNCSTDNYWGRDYMNKTLVGKKKRHHRFPFRDEVNKPLVTTSTNTVNIDKFKLTLVITLASGKDYPVDGDSNPRNIAYSFNYRVDGTATDVNYSGTLVDTLVGTNIVIYDDTVALDNVFTGAYFELDGSSELATYQPSSDETFVITATYTPYTVQSLTNVDTSEIFGIRFSNIEKPSPTTVGFYIVRNERVDNDKLIVDNAIFGATIENQNYRSFGLINPKQYYTASNCGRVDNSGKILVYNKRTTWFFNPEFQYLQKKADFNGVKIQGKYTETSVNMPTTSNVEGSPCNSGNSKGVYVDDVQAGTSYNPDVNKAKNKDDDGFDLIIGYRNTNIAYANNSTVLPDKDKAIYLNAASYENYDFNSYYNVSIDNKIGMLLTTGDLDTELFYNTGNGKNSLLYGSLLSNNENIYSNFIDRPYYKEHNNPILFGTNNVINNVDIYNGDAEISAMNFVSSVYYDMVVADRPKKSSIWKIVLGAVLVVAAIAATIVTAGAASAALVTAVGSLSALAISYGVSLAISGIKFEQFKAMIDVDYEKGLKDTITDGGVYECVRENIETEDDTIRWFSDMTSNVYMESSIPFGLRCGLTSGVTDFINSPVAQFDESGFRSYLTEKLTTIDRDQGSGRLYKGYATAEVYDINLDYMRFNKEKIYSHLATEYDCCSDSTTSFPRRIWNSEQSFQEEKTDNYSSFLPNNYVDIEGEYGEITNMYVLGNNLFIHSREGLWLLPENTQERVSNEGFVSYIGTGSLFSFLPKRVADSSPGTGGSIHKWATVKTPVGVFFLSESENTIYIHSDRLKDISVDGLENWSKEHFKQNLSEQLYTNFSIKYPNSNNQANPMGTGYVSAYDKKRKRILITKRDYLITEDKLAHLEIVSSKPISGTGFKYDSSTGIFYFGTDTLSFDNTTYFENKSFTLSYSLVKKGRWASWHSYIPLFYIFDQTNLYSYIDPNDVNDITDNFLFKHNNPTSFQIFYNKLYPFIVQGVKKIKGINDEVTQDFSFYTEAKTWDSTRKAFLDKRNITFNKLTLSNTRQCSGEIDIVPKNVFDVPVNYLANQISNSNNLLLLSRRGRNWNVNGFRDFINNYDEAMFSSRWIDILENYFIDEVINNSTIDLDKNWWELESFKDKYLLFRLKFDTFSNTSLTVDFSIFTDQQDINP